MKTKPLAFLLSLCLAGQALAAEPRSVSGIYPHLAYYNNEGECGTGAVVPWADRLWVITYGPHLPLGSSDKLYEIDAALAETIHPESVGGTPANRMIHRESNQLFIGPYAIDAERKVRVITPQQMYGRLTGNARHLTDPANKLYYATMEEGIYEVDVHSLAVTELWADEQRKQGRHADLPGYHGKGLYTGQGHLIYANNGDHAPKALSDPTTPSGVLAEWDGKADHWTVVRRNQFTELTGPGGIYGSEHPETDPVWSIGWDAKSLILMLLDGGRWHSYRLPKVSHAYDGAHGWNTEWPRIREIGEKDLLMTMHGAFWRFPKTFSAANPNGIRVRSAYLKVIGDFCRWNDRLVFGCDDTAKAEFLNKRSVKGGIAGPGQSQSNLWFIGHETLDYLGPAPAGGAVWLRSDVKAGEEAEPFLVAGWPDRSAWFVNEGSGEARFSGDLGEVTLAPGASKRVEITGDAEWVRVKATADAAKVSVVFNFSGGARGSTVLDEIYRGTMNGLASLSEPAPLDGLLHARGENKRTLSVATSAGYYELDGELNLKRVEDPKAEEYVQKAVAIPKNVITLDDASVLVIDDRKRRWRLPKGDPAFDALTNRGELRICREVSTERDLFSACGTFYELPAENADGFAKIRPISSHNFRVTDYTSYRGMLVMTGLDPKAPTGRNVIRSDDGKAAVWVGAIDQLWWLGRPRGEGGPWKDTIVKSGEPSDPYLLWGYEDRTLKLSHDATTPVTFRVELDLTGTGVWVQHESVTVPPGKLEVELKFAPSVQARWVRVTASAPCTATAWLTYR
ncbi:MAG TPA: hypothetical protein VGO11_04120 [Chthoniobacteraceae bacterium]|nr:hypothetical protein [Chthoniobacteraceae bacterium]